MFVVVIRSEGRGIFMLEKFREHTVEFIARCVECGDVDKDVAASIARIICTGCQG